MGIYLSPYEHLSEVLEGIYLESGFIKTTASGKCSEDAYKPATLHYDSATATYVSSTTTPLQGRVTRDLIDPPRDESPFTGEALAEGSESLSVGCKVKAPFVIDYCAVVHGDVDGPDAYCGLDLQFKKEAQELVPSSMFSGKLRLLVQAMYGSTRTDYRRDGFGLKITGGGLEVVLSRGFEGGSWLYTTARFDYFLCTYSSGQVTFRKLTLYKESEAFRGILDGHARVGEFTFVTKVEAYILAMTTFSLSIQVVQITGDAINGSTLDYGWHAKWDGHTATAVCFYVDLVNDEYVSDQHQLTISDVYNAQADTYAFTVSNTRLQQDKPWWPWTNTLNVLYYDDALQSMVPVELLQGKIGVGEGTFDSPIYNYYSLDGLTGVETLHTVNIYMDIDASPANINIDLSGDKYRSTTAHTRLDKKTYTGAAGSKGFKVAAQLMDVQVISTSFEDTVVTSLDQYFGMDATSVAARGNNGSAVPISDHATEHSLGFLESLGYVINETREVGENTQHLMFVHYRFTWTDNQIQYLNGHSKQGEAFMQTVLGDCANVILCRSITESHSGKTVSERAGYTKYLGGLLFWSIQPAQNPPPVTDPIAEMPGPLYVSALPTYSGTGSITSDSFPADPGTNVKDISTFKQGTAAQQTITDEVILAEYLQPTTSDPKTGTVDVGRESLGNLHKTTHSAFSTTQGFLHESSTGWA